MTRKAINLKPRREFLRLAAFTGAAALTANGVVATGEQNVGPQTADSHAGDDKMEFLRVSGRHIVNAKGKEVRLRGTCPGGWMNVGDFIIGHPCAELTLRQREDTPVASLLLFCNVEIDGQLHFISHYSHREFRRDSECRAADRSGA